MDSEKGHEAIIAQLEKLNTRVARMNSVRTIFFTGVVYGIGFFVGSAIIATIALGIFGPWFGQIEWVRENFERGGSIMN